MVVESIGNMWPGWFDWLGMVMLGLIVLFEYIDWNFDKDLEILKSHTQILKDIQKILEKSEARLERIEHK